MVKRLSFLQKTHGSPTNANRHVGDLGNIKVDHGRASIDITDKVASLFGSQDMSVSNRKFSIPAKCTSLPHTLQDKHHTWVCEWALIT